MLFHPDIYQFNDLRKKFPVLDVRSPGEYTKGHIPGAVNLPLFDDRERMIIGTTYQQIGMDSAMLQGLDFAGKKLSSYLQQALAIVPDRVSLMHCWRGGKRSESLGGLLSLAGFEIYLLTGGYKAYRKSVRESFEKDQKIIILAGKTGSGKTEILQQLKKNNQQIVDLEYIAHHKGSVFGAFGEMPQPTNEQFENDLAEAWNSLDVENLVWVEDESKAIGGVFLPENLLKKMNEALVIYIDVPKKIRIERLIRDYSTYPKELITKAILKISRRLGGQNVKLAISAIDQNDFAKGIEIILNYYDKVYDYDLSLKPADKLLRLSINTLDANFGAEELLNFSKRLNII